MDKWTEWLTNRRYGTNKEFIAQNIRGLERIRDKIITDADIKVGESVLDVGAGDGLLGFEALEKVGPEGSVVLSDISRDALKLCQEYIDKESSKNIFIKESSAESLIQNFEESSFDVIVSRAVLCYIEDKQLVLDNYHKLLRDGGRISICEPINSFSRRINKGVKRLLGMDLTPLGDELASKLLGSYGYSSEEDFDRDPMTNFDERDLFDFAMKSKFKPININYSASFRDGVPVPNLDAILHFTPNPNAPMLIEVLDTLDSSEREKTIAYFSDTINARRLSSHYAECFMFAKKSLD